MAARKGNMMWALEKQSRGKKCLDQWEINQRKKRTTGERLWDAGVETVGITLFFALFIKFSADPTVPYIGLFFMYIVIIAANKWEL